MKSTLYGVIKVDPKKLLEDGIRKELVKMISSTLHNGLIMNNGPKGKKVDLTQKLESLQKTMNGLKTSFQYIQDYVNIPGLRIWQEELSRIFNFYVEQESNAYSKQKILPWASVYQSKHIPIPFFVSDQQGGLTFMGKLMQELIQQTNPRMTIFVPVRQTWYDFKTQAEVGNLTKLFPLLEKAIGTFGMTGLDRLLGLQATTVLQKIVGVMETNVFKDKTWFDLLENMFNSLNPIENVIA